MQNPAAFANPSNLRRLTIGVTNDNGERAEIVLEKSGDAPYAPLTPVIDEAPAQPAPTERELNEMFLLAHGWERITLDGINPAWQDPRSGAAMSFENAVWHQHHRNAETARAALPPLQISRDIKMGNIRIMDCDNITVEQLRNYFDPHMLRSMLANSRGGVTVEFFI